MVVGQLTIAFGTSTRGFGSNWVLFWGGKVCRLIWSKSKWGGMCPPTSSILYKNWRVGVYPPLFRMNSGKNVGALFTTLSLVQAQQRCSSQGGHSLHEFMKEEPRNSWNILVKRSKVLLQSCLFDDTKTHSTQTDYFLAKNRNMVLRKNLGPIWIGFHPRRLQYSNQIINHQRLLDSSAARRDTPKRLA